MPPLPPFQTLVVRLRCPPFRAPLTRGPENERIQPAAVMIELVGDT